MSGARPFPPGSGAGQTTQKTTRTARRVQKVRMHHGQRGDNWTTIAARKSERLQLAFTQVGRGAAPVRPAGGKRRARLARTTASAPRVTPDPAPGDRP